MADKQQKAEQGTTEVKITQETPSGQVVAQQTITRPTEVSVEKEQQIAQSIGFGF